MQLGTVPDWISAVFAVLTFCIACAALEAWRTQLRGSNQHAIAQEIEIAARTLRYAFYDVRSPLFSAVEFPTDYDLTRRGHYSTEEEAAAYQHVFNNRWKDLYPSYLALGQLRPKAGAVLGEPVADAIDKLARKTRELARFMGERVKQISDGPEIVAQWTDQAWVQRVQSGVTATTERNDPYSREFEQLFAALSQHLKPYQVR